MALLTGDAQPSTALACPPRLHRASQPQLAGALLAQARCALGTKRTRRSKADASAGPRTAACVPQGPAQVRCGRRSSHSWHLQASSTPTLQGQHAQQQQAAPRAPAGPRGVPLQLCLRPVLALLAQVDARDVIPLAIDALLHAAVPELPQAGAAGPSHALSMLWAALGSVPPQSAPRRAAAGRGGRRHLDFSSELCLLVIVVILVSTTCVPCSVSACRLRCRLLQAAAAAGGGAGGRAVLPLLQPRPAQTRAGHLRGCWALTAHGHVHGRVPVVDLAAHAHLLHNTAPVWDRRAVQSTTANAAGGGRRMCSALRSVREAARQLAAPGAHASTPARTRQGRAARAPSCRPSASAWTAPGGLPA